MESDYNTNLKGVVVSTQHGRIGGAAPDLSDDGGHYVPFPLFFLTNYHRLHRLEKLTLSALEELDVVYCTMVELGMAP